MLDRKQDNPNRHSRSGGERFDTYPVGANRSALKEVLSTPDFFVSWLEWFRLGPCLSLCVRQAIPCQFSPRFFVGPERLPIVVTAFCLGTGIHAALLPLH